MADQNENSTLINTWYAKIFKVTDYEFELKVQ